MAELRRRWVRSVLVWGTGLAFAFNVFDSWDRVLRLKPWQGLLLPALPFIAALVCWALGRNRDDSGKRFWRKTACCWLLIASAIWLSIGYWRNSYWIFYGAILAALAALAGMRRVVGQGGLWIQGIHTAILLLVALPLADFVFYRWIEPAPMERSARDVRINGANAAEYYSFAAARGDPRVFAVWWNFWWDAMNGLLRDLAGPAPGFRPPIRLRPRATARLVDCPIAINSLGFRGKEFPIAKGDHYRIVALGESTTFGMTMRANDKPWPELLEAMIRGRLKPSRSVEVINAGTPGYDLRDNLRRLEPDILPLHPDLIISYHGYNGFPMLDKSFPSLLGPSPPEFPARPLKLAAAAEHRLALRVAVREEMRLASAVPSNIIPLQTPYAAAYRQLIDFAETNRIRVALANFCLAVDETSSSKAVRFYGSCGCAEMCVRLRANSLHSEIVRQLAAADRNILFIDAQPGLNAQPEKFVDVVHLTQAGNEQLAENIFRAIRPRLERELDEHR